MYAHGQNISDTGHSHLEAHDRLHNADATDDMEEDPIHTIDEDQGHQTTFNDSAAAPHNEDQTHAMEEDLDQNQGKDHCTSMVYSSGQSIYTYSKKQRKNLRNKIKKNIKKKENKFKKKLEERKMPSDS